MKRQKFNPIIQTTTDYSKFKFLNGNRLVNQLHIRRLTQSIKNNPLVTLILVNEKMEIIDGQHRFTVLKQLEMPINYMVVYGYGVKEVQILNANMSNWNKNDYLDGYVKMGKEEYIKFKEFKDEFPELKFSVLVKLARLLTSHKTKIYDGIKGTIKDFEGGTFYFPDIEKTYKYAEMIMDYKPYFKKFNDNTFCITLMSLFSNPNYDHKTMLHKISINPNLLQTCRTQGQYLLKLEEIFNYKNKNKVSLRY